MSVADAPDFVPTERTRLRRLHERGHFDRQTVYDILDAGFVCHVAYAIDDQPYVTPTIYWREDDHVVWHGSSASRMLRQVKTGVPVCFTVTHIDGLVLARSGFHHSMNYRSVMALGTARPIEDPSAKLASLKTFMDGLYPGRWAEARPPDAQELKATTVLTMPLQEVSAKVRSGPPVDDDEDYALPCWAGVLPLSTVAGAPRDDGRLADGVDLPDYMAPLKAWLERR